jgi:phosphohistidine phosphatase
MHPCLVIRHGAAEEAEAGGVDSERSLTRGGRDEVEAMAAGVAGATPRPAVILSSPYERASQTAAILSRALGGVPVETLDTLASNASPVAILEALVERCHSADTAFAIVGHEPDLGRFISYALAASARGFHAPRKASVCLLEFPMLPRAGNATLEWAMEPQHLAAIGRESTGRARYG